MTDPISLHNDTSLLDVFLKTIPHGIQENDLEGKITYINKASHQIFGYSPSELEGMYIWDLQPTEEQKQSLKSYFTNIIKNQPDPIPYLAKNHRRDGSIVEVRVDWNYKRDTQGQLTGFISVITDISEKTSLEHDHLFHLEILQNIGEGVCLFQASSGEMIYTNPKFDEMFGYSTGELVGKPVFVLNTRNDKSIKTIAKEVFAAIKQCGTWNGEVHHQRKDGSTFWSNTTVSSFEHQKLGSIVISIHQDITEKKHAEEIRRRSEKKYRDLF